MEADRPSWRSHTWLVATVVLVLVVFVLTTTGVDQPAAAGAMLAVSGVILVAALVWALVRSRAERRRHEDALAVWAAERAAQAERFRIAGDLHDLVSHGLGLITLRAAAAARVAGPAADSERSAALADIERAGRETTTELRRMLGVLRSPGRAPMHPVDSLVRLPAIVRAAEAAGLTVQLRSGELGDVSPGVQLTVCAVVREALHNTARHAGPTAAEVVVERSGSDIIVTVCDAGRSVATKPQPGTGHGLDGLRERVAALGGSLDAGPAGSNGFRVVARIPDRNGR